MNRRVVTEEEYRRLQFKYAHIGCPEAHYEDTCPHPDDCAENGRCLDLPPLPDPVNK